MIHANYLKEQLQEQKGFNFEPTRKTMELVQQLDILADTLYIEVNNLNGRIKIRGGVNEESLYKAGENSREISSLLALIDWAFRLWGAAKSRVLCCSPQTLISSWNRLLSKTLSSLSSFSMIKFLIFTKLFLATCNIVLAKELQYKSRDTCHTLQCFTQSQR